MACMQLCKRALYQGWKLENQQLSTAGHIDCMIFLASFTEPAAVDLLKLSTITAFCKKVSLLIRGGGGGGVSMSIGGA